MEVAQPQHVSSDSESGMRAADWRVLHETVQSQWQRAQEVRRASENADSKPRT